MAGTKKDKMLETNTLIQDMYDGCTPSVRTQLGTTESFDVKVENG